VDVSDETAKPREFEGHLYKLEGNRIFFLAEGYTFDFGVTPEKAAEVRAMLEGAGDGKLVGTMTIMPPFVNGKAIP
jgi:hypothetical protein